MAPSMTEAMRSMAAATNTVGGFASAASSSVASTVVSQNRPMGRGMNDSNLASAFERSNPSTQLAIVLLSLPVVLTLIMMLLYTVATMVMVLRCVSYPLYELAVGWAVSRGCTVENWQEHCPQPIDETYWEMSVHGRIYRELSRDDEFEMDDIGLQHLALDGEPILSEVETTRSDASRQTSIQELQMSDNGASVTRSESSATDDEPLEIYYG